MFLFSGRECGNLAESVARKANLTVGKVKIKTFPDGEIYVRVLEEVKGQECVVLQSTPSNDALMELLFILDALRNLGAEKIHAVIPYLGYARQDKIFLSGEPLSAKLVLEMIKNRAESITTINAHFLDTSGKQSYENIEMKNLNAFTSLADYLKSKVDDPVLVSPDEGALGYLEEAGKLAKLQFDYFQKTRTSDEEVEMKIKEMDVSRKDVIILDDIISTGGTMVKATKILYDQGARSVNIGAVHGVLLEGMEKISQVADLVVCSNSIYRERYSQVSLSELIGNFLR